jgi:hypothetical protein
MAKLFDIMCGSDGDLAVENGDFAIDQSNEQHNEHIMISNFGDWKQWLMVGFNILRFFKGTDEGNAEKFERDLRVQIEDIDGRKLQTVDLSEGLTKPTIIEVE